MSEPKLTVGRVETWRPINYREEIYQRGDLPENFVLRLTAAINERMAALAPPAPQPEAKAEPDRVRAAIDRLRKRAVAAAGPSDERWQDAEDDASTIDARIAELIRERDEARAVPASWHTARRIEDAYEEGRLNGEAAGYAKGAAAAKEACAKRLEREAVNRSDCSCSGCDTVRKWLRQSSHIVRETEVPGP